MNTITINPDALPDAPAVPPHFLRRVRRACGLTLYYSTRLLGTPTLRVVGGLLGIISWTRHEATAGTVAGVKLVVRVFGRVVWNTADAVRAALPRRRRRDY